MPVVVRTARGTEFGIAASEVIEVSEEQVRALKSALRPVERIATEEDIEQAAERCRFRDCKHENEPGCAVRAAVEAGEIAPERFASYQALKQETATLRTRREEARRMRGEKASDKKRAGKGARPGHSKRRR